MAHEGKGSEGSEDPAWIREGVKKKRKKESNRVRNEIIRVRQEGKDLPRGKYWSMRWETY